MCLRLVSKEKTIKFKKDIVFLKKQNNSYYKVKNNFVFSTLKRRKKKASWSYCTPTRRLPRCRIGECRPDMVGTGNIPGRAKTSTASLQLVEKFTKARGS